MAKKRKLDIESTTMHKVDGMEPFDKSTTEIYAPKKASDMRVNNESLFNDSYMDEKASKSDTEAEIPTAVVVVITVIVVAAIAFGVYYFMHR